jgi:hypothetical protein
MPNHIHLLIELGDYNFDNGIVPENAAEHDYSENIGEIEDANLQANKQGEKYRRNKKLAIQLPRSYTQIILNICE